MPLRSERTFCDMSVQQVMHLLSKVAQLCWTTIADSNQLRFLTQCTLRCIRMYKRITVVYLCRARHSRAPLQRQNGLIGACTALQNCQASRDMHCDIGNRPRACKHWVSHGQSCCYGVKSCDSCVITLARAIWCIIQVDVPTHCTRCVRLPPAAVIRLQSPQQTFLQ